VELLRSSPVVRFPDIQAALGGASSATVFRYLKQVPYRTSYNHNGRYYALHDPSRYDRRGLFSHGDIHFSLDGTLKATVRRLVWEADAGHTHRELQDLLRVRVQVVLLDLLGKHEVGRERVDGIFVYLHIDAAVRQGQLQRREEQLVAGSTEQGEVKLGDDVVIQVLLVLIRYPGSRPEDVVRHLRGHAPPITMQQVSAVFARYQLGEKGGPSIC
jgi:hypothetical protein